MWRLPTRSEDVFKQFVDLKSWPGYTQTLSGWCGNWAQRLPSGCEILAAPLCPPGPGRPRHGPLLQAHSPGYGVRPSHHYLRQAPAPLPPLLASPQLRTPAPSGEPPAHSPWGRTGPEEATVPMSRASQAAEQRAGWISWTWPVMEQRFPGPLCLSRSL